MSENKVEEDDDFDTESKVLDHINSFKKEEIFLFLDFRAHPLQEQSKNLVDQILIMFQKSLIYIQWIRALKKNLL